MTLLGLLGSGTSRSGSKDDNAVSMSRAQGFVAHRKVTRTSTRCPRCTGTLYAATDTRLTSGMIRLSSPCWYSPVRSTVPCSGYTLPITTSRGYLASPRPLRDWNVVTETSSTPNATSSALSATTTPQVTQLGDLTRLAQSPSKAFAAALSTASFSTSGFASGTESGLVGSKRAWGDIEKTLIPAAASLSSISPCSGAMNESAVRHSPRSMTSSTLHTRADMSSVGKSIGFHKSGP
mmetsp:Transcript_9710/g.44189  ORF Transcript_9710/g.44189 Transcript_9710/m.44189 type:complete len:236 (+) Transcript_9710:4866-5573(+)